MRETIERGSPYWDVIEGSYSPDELDKFEDGDIGAIVMRKSASTPAATRQPGLEVPNTHHHQLAYHDKNIVAESGADTYALGNTVQGTQYAAEVNAIKGAAGLTPGSIARSHSAHWERTITKYLGACALYDDMPVRIRYDDVTLNFDANDPIKDYLQPDAKVTVREDSMAYAPKQQQIAQAQVELQTAMSVAQLYPRAVGEAMKRWLEAIGVKNQAAWLEQPARNNNLAPPDQGVASAQAAGIA